MPKCLCGRDTCQVKRSEALVLWVHSKLRSLTEALVAVETDRLIQREPAIEKDVV